MTQNTTKSELRNQHESQSDGFADVAATKARPENVPANTNVPAQTVNLLSYGGERFAELPSASLRKLNS
jgi:hypothetical protein